MTENITVVFSGHLIFDRFPSLEMAQRFATAIGEHYERETHVFTDVDTAYGNEVFPFGLDPPIVHVDRVRAWEQDDEQEIERAIEAEVENYGGTFAGT